MTLSNISYQITDWWVAKANLKMAFVNIFSKESLSQELLVVGFSATKKRKLITSASRVEKVTKHGVITEEGAFYPFYTAHNLYLHFLIEAYEKSAIIATNWDYAKKWCKRIIIADIVKDGKTEKGVTFDFISDKRHDVMLSGYSLKLSSNIILTTFARRNVCIEVSIPKSVKFDIWRSSFQNDQETIEKVRLIQKNCKERFVQT